MQPVQSPWFMSIFQALPQASWFDFMSPLYNFPINSICLRYLEEATLAYKKSLIDTSLQLLINSTAKPIPSSNE